MIEYHDEINDKRSYTIILDRFKKEFNISNFIEFDYEILKIYEFIKNNNFVSFNNKKFLNYRI